MGVTVVVGRILLVDTIQRCVGSYPTDRDDVVV